MCQTLEQCSMGNFIHEVKGKKKEAGTDSIQLFSIKLFIACMKYSVSVWAELLDCTMQWLKACRVFNSTR